MPTIRARYKKRANIRKEHRRIKKKELLHLRHKIPESARSAPLKKTNRGLDEWTEEKDVS